MRPAVRAAVFDLGGVLLRLRNPVDLFGLELPETRFHELWLLSHSVRAFESGAIDHETFARDVVAELALEMPWPDFLRRFDAWPDCLFPDALTMLDAIPAGIARGLLSNTNAIHWGRTDISGLLSDRFDHCFLSYETGLLKPDRQSFEQVARAFGCAADEIVYFDDNPLNVDAAGRAGLQAHLARCPGDAARVIAVLRQAV